jgi:ribose transport system substrate-binding protein
MSRKLFTLFIVALSLLAALPLSASASGETTYTIGLSLPGEDNILSVGLQEGAQQAADDLGATLVVVSADMDLETELANTQALVDQGVNAILFSPVDPAESQAAIQIANDAEIPVFLVGAALDPDADVTVVSAIASNDVESGEKAGEELCAAVNETGTVLELVGAPAESAEDEDPAFAVARARSEGFNTYMAEHCADVTLLTLDAYDLEPDALQQAITDQLTAETIDGVFGYDDASIQAAIQAAIGVRQQRRVDFVGFGVSEDVLAVIKSGLLDASLMPDAWAAGETGVQTSVAFLNGEDVAQVIDVASYLLTSTTLDTFKGCGFFPC